MVACRTCKKREDKKAPESLPATAVSVAFMRIPFGQANDQVSKQTCKVKAPTAEKNQCPREPAPAGIGAAMAGV